MSHWPFQTAEAHEVYLSLKRQGYHLLRAAHALFMAAIEARK